MRDTALADRIVYRWGPASRRVPRRIRRAATPQARISRLPGAQSWYFGAPELVRPTPPRAVGGSLTLSRTALRGSRLPAPFVAELSDAWLVGQHAVPFTNDRRMLLTGLRDTVGALAVERHPDLDAWLALGTREAAVPRDLLRAIGSNPVCSLVGRFDSNYFHWLIDTCGQFEGLREYSRRRGDRPLVLIRAGAPRFVTESLALLGFEHDAVVQWPLSWSPQDSANAPTLVALPIRRLVVPAWRGYRYGCSPSSLAWLRAAFLGATQAAEVEATEKVYIQRPSSAWRHIANEDAVCRELIERGFRVVRPAEHSLAEQIAVFRRACLVVGQHGAGLANILFAPGASVAELVGRYGGPEYWSMCSGLGNPYVRVQCEDGGGDITVDLGALASALDVLGQR